jgi:hypothetical protein
MTLKVLRWSETTHSLLTPLPLALVVVFAVINADLTSRRPRSAIVIELIGQIHRPLMGEYPAQVTLTVEPCAHLVY